MKIMVFKKNNTWFTKTIFRWKAIQCLQYCKYTYKDVHILYIYLFIYSFIYIFIYLFIYLYIYLFVYLFIYLFTYVHLFRILYNLKMLQNISNEILLSVNKVLFFKKSSISLFYFKSDNMPGLTYLNLLNRSMVTGICWPKCQIYLLFKSIVVIHFITNNNV